jgi:hypothetical protein
MLTMDERANAAYSDRRTHGIHSHDGEDCREYVVGECLLDAALAAAPVPSEGLDVTRIASWLHDHYHGSINWPQPRGTVWRDACERMAELLLDSLAREEAETP